MQDRRGLDNRSAADTLMAPNEQISAKMNINISLAAADAAAVLDVGYPMGFNKSTGNHAPWMAPDPTVLAIYLGSTPATGGTFGITVNSNAVEVDIAFDATADEVVAALKGMGYDVSCVLAADTYTITFDGQPEIETLPTVVGTVADLTGDTASSATTTAGTSTYGTDAIQGFINPNPTQIGTEAGTAALVVLAGTDTVCTGTTDNPHNLVTGMSMTFTGASDAKLNITATITVTSPYTFTYTVSAVSGGVVTSGTYTTTNDIMAIMMTEGDISASLPQGLVATADVTALNTALKDNLVAKNIYVQGLAGVH